MSALRELTVAEIKFLTHYIQYGVGKDAALHIRPDLKNPYDFASKLLKDKRIMAAMAELKEEEIEVLITTTNRVMTQLSRIAFADPAGLFTDTGRLRDIHKIPKDLRARIAGIEIEDRSADEDFVTVVKVKLNNNLDALDKIARRLNMFDQDNKGRSAIIRVGYGEEE